MTEGTAIALLASSVVGSLLGLVAITIVLVVVTKQLRRVVAVLRGEEGGAGVHMSLLAAAAPPPDAFVVAKRPMAGVRGVDLRTGNCCNGGDGGDGGDGGGGGGSGGSGGGDSGSHHPTSSSSSTASSSNNYDGKRGSLKKPAARLPSPTTSCAIHEVDEEDDHTL